MFAYYQHKGCKVNSDQSTRYHYIYKKNFFSLKVVFCNFDMTVQIKLLTIPQELKVSTCTIIMPRYTK